MNASNLPGSGSASSGSERGSGPTVVLGVTQGQPESVVLQAAKFAARFDAELVCVHVDTTRYMVEALADGTIAAFPLDPDIPDLMPEAFDPEFELHLEQVLSSAPVAVEWSVREVAGEPAQEISRVAEERDAALIVVGARQPGLRAGMREFFAGSVAVHLAHRQSRPVVVIPTSPVPQGDALPWEVE
jgi:nucleotide-binding universal stress UspA family protein